MGTSIKQLSLRLLTLFPIYFLLRVGFFFYHIQNYKAVAPSSILMSFVIGLRFDYSAIFWSSIPLILLSFIPLKSKILELVKSLVFVLTTTAVILMSVDDYELVQFMGKRLSRDLFVIGDDIWHQLPQLMMYYWYFPLITVLLGAGIWKFDKKFFRPMTDELSIPKFFLALLGIVGLTVLALRGGWQRKPMSVQSAFIQGEHDLGLLVLNTPYHFLRTFNNNIIKPVGYLSESEVQSYVQSSELNYQGKKNANIVILILESFSLEYMEKGYMPYLSSLKEKALFFPHHLANGRRSIEALPAILNSLPSLLDEPISKSSFQSNQFTGLGQILKKHGYTNYFFHGGFKGTMSFDAYVLSNGFDKYFAKEDYPVSKDFDGNWGIYDGPFLKYSIDVLDKTPTPFMAGIFTLSSHQPYAIPSEWQGKFPKGNLEIHESVGYVDEMVKEFFEKAQKCPWFKDTIFIITADHTQKHETGKFNNFIGRFRVPMIIYSPEHTWENINTTQVSQHADIPGTLLDFVGVHENLLPRMGRSVLSGGQGLAVVRDNGEFGLVRGDEVYRMDSVSKINWETGEETERKPSESKILKAYLQYYLNGLINNNLGPQKTP